MAEELHIDTHASKQERYAALLPQIVALTSGESDLTANLANICAALKYGMGFFWVGFYLAKDGELVLGPFQGTVACTRIPFDKSVCGACYRAGHTLVVPNVDEFPGHIACSSASKSEIVVPVLRNDEVFMVLDVDSDRLDDFDDTDREWLEQLAAHIARLAQ